MNKQIITFSADEQKLVKTGGINCYASNIVSYIEAHFTLGANWSGYDSVRAVWSNDNNMTAISTVLDSGGVCVVPFEVLKTKGTVMVNLVGSISASDVLTDRLTTFPCEALTVARKAKINGSETAPITPSQFEQFVAVVISEVGKVTGMTAEAETLPAGSQATARYEDGILYLGIPQGIQGIQGEAGADGADGNGIAQVLYNSDYSITFVFTNGERFTTPSLRGETGPQGQPGQNGRDGTDGRDGADGVTPSLSVGTVTTLPSTEDAYVTRRGMDDNPVFDFGIPQGPKGDTGEVSLEQLSDLLPTDTASGSIASFPDGQSVIPAVSVKVEIEPIQDLHGYDKPWSGGAGKNKLPYPYDETTKTVNGITFTVSSDGTVTVNGTATATAALYLVSYGANTFDGMILNGSPSGSVAVECAIAVQYYNGGSFSESAFETGNGLTLKQSDNINILVRVGSGVTVNNKVFKPMIRLASVSDATFTPYENICPISGHTEVDVVRTGENLLDDNSSALESGSIYGDTGLDSASTTRVRYKNMMPFDLDSIVDSGYTLTIPNGYDFAIRYYDEDNNYIYLGSAYTGFANSIFSDVFYGKGVKKARLVYRKSNNSAITPTDLNHVGFQLEIGSTATEYEPYNGQSYTTQLGQTIYGGVLDVVSGELVVDKAMVDMTSITDWNIDRNAKRIYKVLSYIKPNTSGATVPNLLSNRFEAITPNAIYADTQGVSVSTGSALQFHIDGLTDKADVTLAEINQWFTDNPTTVVYELATPQTYQLTPTEIALLKGTNNVWCDTGEVEVTYKADVGLYIDKKLNV